MTLLTSCSNNPLATSPHSRRSHTGNFPFTIFQFTDIQSTTTTLHSHICTIVNILTPPYLLSRLLRDDELLEAVEEAALDCEHWTQLLSVMLTLMERL